MRLIESVCSIVVISLFMGTFASALRPVQRMLAETNRLTREYDCDCFVAKSFSRLCEKSALKAELDDWRALCSAQWQLEKIEIASAGFDEDGHRILRCTWKYQEEERTVLAVN